MVASSSNVARHVLRSIRRKIPFSVQNSLLQGESEVLSTRSPTVFKWYSCGPTVYDDAHIGHARTCVSLDIIRRIISSWSGLRIDYGHSITDVDDKILNRSEELGVKPLDLARRFETRFFEDMKSLNVLPPKKILRVSEHIDELQALISDLIKQESAYVASSGNVYFSVPSAGDRYWQLDRGRVSSVGNEDDDDLSEKKNPRDFALWKRAATGKYSLEWESPWGPGRPGWHVECSAMVMSSMGHHLDLHTGGIDLKFPHHTNELAISESKLCLHDMCGLSQIAESRWCNTWLHCGSLRVSGEKMSKSLRNFITISDFLEDHGSADDFRMFCLMHRYSTAVDYHPEKLNGPRGFLKRVRTFLTRDALSKALEDNLGGIDVPSMHPKCQNAVQLEIAIQKTEDDIEDAVTDNFDTPKAVASLARLVTTSNTLFTSNQRVSGAMALAYESAKHLVFDTLKTFGISSESLVLAVSKDSPDRKDELERLIHLLVGFRSAVRNAARQKDAGAIFEECDAVRDLLRAQSGVRIADKKDGKSTWVQEF